MNISTFFPLEDCSLIFADVKWILYLFSAINAYFFWLVVFGVLFAYKSTTFLLLILQIFLCFVIYVSHPKDLELFALFCFKVECILVINNDVESTSLICFLLLCVRNYFFFFLLSLMYFVWLKWAQTISKTSHFLHLLLPLNLPTFPLVLDDIEFVVDWSTVHLMESIAIMVTWRHHPHLSVSTDGIPLSKLTNILWFLLWLSLAVRHRICLRPTWGHGERPG